MLDTTDKTRWLEDKMRTRLVGVALMATALLLAACGTGEGDGDTESVGTVPTLDTTTSVPDVRPADEVQGIVYLLSDEGLLAVPRSLPANVDLATATMESLLDGPSADEVAEGLSTAIPRGTRLLGVDQVETMMVVDLSVEYEAGGGSFAILTRLGQVVCTLDDLEGVEGVRFHLEGSQVEVFSGEGVVLDGPALCSDYDDLRAGAPTDDTVVDTRPAVDGPQAGSLLSVILVEGDDVLNIREDPGVEAPVIAELAPTATGIVATGNAVRVGSSTWIQLEVSGVVGWANQHFLAPGQGGPATSAAATNAVNAFLDALDGVGDLSNTVSERGLYIAHLSEPIRFSAAGLDSLLADATLLNWPSLGCGEDCGDATFADAVAEPVLSTWRDLDTEILFEAFDGGNGLIAEAVVPVEFTNLRIIGAYDVGDDPQYGGLDWQIWYVYLAIEDGSLKVLGLSLNEWGP